MFVPTRRRSSAAALADGFVPLESIGVIAGSAYVVRELSLFPSRSPKVTRIHK
jgi:hypothetical protein